MGFEITNIEDLLSLWPDNPKMTQTATEIHTYCPFCPPNDESIIWNGIAFTGEDRFVINNGGAFCRTCMNNGRKRHYSFDDIVARFSDVTLSPDFVQNVSHLAQPARPPEL